VKDWGRILVAWKFRTVASKRAFIISAEFITVFIPAFCGEDEKQDRVWGSPSGGLNCDFLPEGSLRVPTAVDE
jgi:hypothetical protein